MEAINKPQHCLINLNLDLYPYPELLYGMLDTFFNYMAYKGVCVTEIISKEDLEELRTSIYQPVVTDLIDALWDYDYFQMRILHWPRKCSMSK